jgi:hypothetical protein
MTLKNDFLTAHSISEGIGMNERQSIQCVRIADKHAISFYNWMQDNYFQVADGFVKDRNIDESKRIIITIENAMSTYKKEHNI